MDLEQRLTWDFENERAKKMLSSLIVFARLYVEGEVNDFSGLRLVKLIESALEKADETDPEVAHFQNEFEILYEHILGMHHRKQVEANVHYLQKMFTPHADAPMQSVLQKIVDQANQHIDKAREYLEDVSDLHEAVAVYEQKLLVGSKNRIRANGHEKMQKLYRKTNAVLAYLNEKGFAQHGKQILADFEEALQACSEEEELDATEEIEVAKIMERRKEIRIEVLSIFYRHTIHAALFVLTSRMTGKNTDPINLDGDIEYIKGLIAEAMGEDVDVEHEQKKISAIERAVY